MTTDNTVPFDYFLSDQLEKIRNDMFDLTNRLMYCEGCYNDEKVNGYSHRTMYNEKYKM